MSETKPDYGLGTAIGIIFWGFCFLSLSYRHGIDWLNQIWFYLGFVLVLVGSMGFCVLKFKR